jgi:hypothetical protein
MWTKRAAAHIDDLHGETLSVQVEPGWHGPGARCHENASVPELCAVCTLPVRNPRPGWLDIRDRFTVAGQTALTALRVDGDGLA